MPCTCTHIPQYPNTHTKYPYKFEVKQKNNKKFQRAVITDRSPVRSTDRSVLPTDRSLRRSIAVESDRSAVRSAFITDRSVFNRTQISDLFQHKTRKILPKTPIILHNFSPKLLITSTPQQQFNSNIYSKNLNMFITQTLG